MRLHTKNNMSCFPRREKAGLLETRDEQHNEHLTEVEKKISAQIRSELLLPSMKELISIKQLLNFYVNIFTRIP